MEITKGKKCKRNDEEVLVTQVSKRIIAYHTPSPGTKSGWSRGRQLMLREDFEKEFSEIKEQYF